MFLQLLKIELIKLLHFKIWLIILLIIPIFVSLYVFVFNQHVEEVICGWQDFFNFSYSDAVHHYITSKSDLFSCLYLIYFVFHSFFIEKRYKSFNVIFTYPSKKITTFNSKLTALTILFTLNVLVIYLSIWILSLAYNDISPLSLGSLLQYWLRLLLTVVFQLFIVCITRSFVLYSLVFIVLFTLSVLYSGMLQIINPYYFVCMTNMDFAQCCYVLIHIGIYYYCGYLSFLKINY